MEAALAAAEETLRRALGGSVNVRDTVSEAKAGYRKSRRSAAMAANRKKPPANPVSRRTSAIRAIKRTDVGDRLRALPKLAGYLAQRRPA